MYIRWGRKACSGNGTELLYWGKCINDTQFYVVVDKVFLKITDPATMFFIFFFIIVLRFRYCQIYSQKPRILNFLKCQNKKRKQKKISIYKARLIFF